MASAGLEEACGEIRGDPRRLALLLAPRSPAERQRIRAAYRASFGEDLAAAVRGNPHAAGSGQEDEAKQRRRGPGRGASQPSRAALEFLLTCFFFFFFFQFRKLLYLWALEPAERDAVVAREAVEGGATVAGYRALVEVFTRRKQDQLFFTKQAYLARFRRNLDQDMVTEPSHPYQRVRYTHGLSILVSFFFQFINLLSWCEPTETQLASTNIAVSW